MSVKQFKIGTNFSYIIYDDRVKLAVLLDPTIDSSRALSFLQSNHLELKSIILTHHHSDHTGDLKTLTSYYPKTQIISSSKASQTPHKGLVIDDNTTLPMGAYTLKFLHTPGHSPESMCIQLDDTALFTGDTLFIGDCGRADLPGGDIQQLFSSLQQLKTLPDQLLIYPGHDYGDKQRDTLGHQKQVNHALLAQTLEDFSKLP